MHCSIVYAFLVGISIAQQTAQVADFLVPDAPYTDHKYDGYKVQTSMDGVISMFTSKDTSNVVYRRYEAGAQSGDLVEIQNVTSGSLPDMISSYGNRFQIVFQNSVIQFRSWDGTQWTIDSGPTYDNSIRRKIVMLDEDYAICGIKKGTDYANIGPIPCTRDSGGTWTSGSPILPTGLSTGYFALSGTGFAYTTSSNGHQWVFCDVYNVGKVAVYKRTDSTGNLAFHSFITGADDLVTSAQLGVYITVRGDYLAGSASITGTHNNQRDIMFYKYNTVSDTWEYQDFLDADYFAPEIPDDISSNFRGVFAITEQGDKLFHGDRNGTSGPERIYIAERNGTSWDWTGDYIVGPTDQWLLNSFNYNSDILNDNLIIGSASYDTGGVNDNGAIWSYNYGTSTPSGTPSGTPTYAPSISAPAPTTPAPSATPTTKSPTTTAQCPCENGGICSGVNDVACHCLYPYHGENCTAIQNCTCPP